MSDEQTTLERPDQWYRDALKKKHEAIARDMLHRQFPAWLAFWVGFALGVMVGWSLCGGMHV